MRTLLVVVLLALAVTPSAPASGKTLVATVGANDTFMIALTLNGKPVRSLHAGSYTIIVHDLSAIHNFALGSQTAGKRVFTTGIPFVGTKTYRVELTKGNYAYACSAHFSTMNGHFTVR